MAVTVSKKSELVAKIDFSDVKDPSPYSPKPVEPGEYLAHVSNVTSQRSKSDDTLMWVFALKLDSVPGAVYPFYCKLTPNQLWKLHQLGIACGLDMPKSVKTVQAEKFVGKALGVIVEEDEYNGKPKGVVSKCIPVSEVGDEPVSRPTTKGAVEEDLEEDTPTPAEDDDDDEDDIDLDEL